MSISIPPALPGDRPPFCYGMNADGGFYSFDLQAGRPAVVILAAGLPPAVVVPLVTLLSGSRSLFESVGADLVILVGGAPLDAFDTQGCTIVDCNPGFFEACGCPTDRPLLLVLDRNVRIAGRFEASEQAAALACLAALPRSPASDASQPAPVLLLPNLLDPQLCGDLMRYLDAAPHSEGMVASLDGEGAPRNLVNHAKKRRRDHELLPEDPLFDRVLPLLVRRCVPEIRRVFNVSVSHLDRVLIARYDDSGGYFRRHRDNVGPAVAFRQFALSLNLNTPDYEGGALCFPEFNDDRHSPPAGGGVVFSASLLHEALPVTSGSRYVLLTFLHDAAAEAKRQRALP